MLLTQAIASEETLDQSMPADDLLLLEGMSPDLALALARAAYARARIWPTRQWTISRTSKG